MSPVIPTPMNPSSTIQSMRRTSGHPLPSLDDQLRPTSRPRAGLRPKYHHFYAMATSMQGKQGWGRWPDTSTQRSAARSALDCENCASLQESRPRKRWPIAWGSTRPTLGGLNEVRENGSCYGSASWIKSGRPDLNRGPPAPKAPVSRHQIRQLVAFTRCYGRPRRI